MVDGLGTKWALILLLCYWMKMLGSKEDLETSRNWQAGLIDTGKVFIIQKSIHLECQQRHSAQRASHRPSCHNKLIDKNCHWLCFIFPVLLRGCVSSATYVNGGLLPDLRDQFCQRELTDGSPSGCRCIENHIKYLLRHTSELHVRSPKRRLQMHPHSLPTCLSHKAN